MFHTGSKPQEVRLGEVCTEVLQPGELQTGWYTTYRYKTQVDYTATSGKYRYIKVDKAVLKCYGQEKCMGTRNSLQVKKI